MEMDTKIAEAARCILKDEKEPMVSTELADRLREDEDVYIQIGDERVSLPESILISILDRKPFFILVGDRSWTTL